MTVNTRFTFRLLGGWLSVDWASWPRPALSRMEISAEFRPLIGDHPDRVMEERRSRLDRHLGHGGMRHG